MTDAKTAPSNIVLQGEDLHGLEFVLGDGGALTVNGQPARATLADCVTDQCGAIVSLTLTPAEGLTADALTRWLAEVRVEE